MSANVDRLLIEDLVRTGIAPDVAASMIRDGRRMGVVLAVARMHYDNGQDCDCAVCAEAGRPALKDPVVNELTGGDWENRANEYWRAWHNSAHVAWEEQTRAERAEAVLERYRAALVDLAGDYGCTLRTPADPSEPPRETIPCRDRRPGEAGEWCYACVASAALEAES